MLRLDMMDVFLQFVRTRWEKAGRLADSDGSANAVALDVRLLLYSDKSLSSAFDVVRQIVLLQHETQTLVDGSVSGDERSRKIRQLHRVLLPTSKERGNGVKKTFTSVSALHATNRAARHSNSQVVEHCEASSAGSEGKDGEDV